MRLTNNTNTINHSAEGDGSLSLQPYPHFRVLPPMTTSRIATSYKPQPDADVKIHPAYLSYFQERLRNRLYDLVLGEFEKAAADHSLTQAQLARRIGKKPEQINRWFSTPGNWTLSTVSDLLLGISGSELNTSCSQIPTGNPADSSQLGTNAGSAVGASKQVMVYNTGSPPVQYMQLAVGGQYAASGVLAVIPQYRSGEK